MGLVRYSTRAELDMVEAFAYIISHSYDDQTATNTMSRLELEIEALADAPLLGRALRGLPANCKSWNVLDNRYRVYYRRISESYIQVANVYPTKRRPLTQRQIKQAFGTIEL